MYSDKEENYGLIHYTDMLSKAEIQAIADDLKSGIGGGADARDYFLECLKAAAQDHIVEYGDDFINGYWLGSMVVHGYAIASDIDHGNL